MYEIHKHIFKPQAKQTNTKIGLVCSKSYEWLSEYMGLRKKQDMKYKYIGEPFHSNIWIF